MVVFVRARFSDRLPYNNGSSVRGDCSSLFYAIQICIGFFFMNFIYVRRTNDLGRYADNFDLTEAVFFNFCKKVTLFYVFVVIIKYIINLSIIITLE